MSFNGSTVEDDNVTFKSLGIIDELCETCERLKWNKPSHIQREVIPVALQGHDIIGLAETGSGKTGAFALPIIQALLERPSKYFALVLTPTRELAEQIAEQFLALGAGIKLKCAILIGGVGIKIQCLALAKKPHIIIATPGRLVDHLLETKGFDLNKLKYLVIDEADKILNMNFVDSVNEILKLIPKQRKTYLFSATMTNKVEKLEKASLKQPIKISVSNKYQISSKLSQYYLLVPHAIKMLYLIHLLKKLAGSSVMIFCGTCRRVELFNTILQNLKFSSVALYGKMSQIKRQKSLEKFKEKKCAILVATDVASRGLDIPHVDCVIIYDVPDCPKDFIHRVGRTARAGRSGQAYTLVTQFDVQELLKIEALLGHQIQTYEADREQVLALQAEVDQITRLSKIQVNDLEKSKKFDKKKRKEGEAGNNPDGRIPSAAGEEKPAKRRKIKK